MQQMTPRVHLSKQLLAAALNPPARGFTVRQLHKGGLSATRCARRDNPKGYVRARSTAAREQIPLLWVSKQPGVLCRQTHCRQEWNRNLRFCSSSLSTEEQSVPIFIVLATLTRSHHQHTDSRDAARLAPRYAQKFIT